MLGELSQRQRGLVYAALDAYEVTLLREARSRQAKGPEYAEFRAQRRQQAAEVQVLSDQLRRQA